MIFEEVFSLFSIKLEQVTASTTKTLHQISDLSRLLKDVSKCRFERENMKEFVGGVGDFYGVLIQFFESNNCDKSLPETRRIFSAPLYVVQSLKINSFFIEWFVSVIDYAIQSYSSSPVLKEVLRVYNVLLMKATVNTFAACTRKHTALKTLYDVIKSCGEIETQAVSTEIFLRLFNGEKGKTLLLNIFPEMQILQSVQRYDFQNLYPNVRMILDVVNSKSSDIFSIICKGISLDQVAIKEHKDAKDDGDIWLDFNMQCRKMSFFCDKNAWFSLTNVSFPSSTSWELISFNIDDVLKSTFARNNSCLIMILKLKASSFHLSSNIAYDCVQNLTVSVSTQAEGFNMLTENLEALFPGSFSSAVLSLTTPDGTEGVSFTDESDQSPVLNKFHSKSKGTTKMSTLRGQSTPPADDAKPVKMAQTLDATASSVLQSDRSSPSTVYGLCDTIVISDDEDERSITSGNNNIRQFSPVNMISTQRKISQHLEFSNNIKRLNKSVTPISMNESLVGVRNKSALRAKILKEDQSTKISSYHIPPALNMSNESSTGKVSQSVNKVIQRREDELEDDGSDSHEVDSRLNTSKIKVKEWLNRQNSESSTNSAEGEDMLNLEQGREPASDLDLAIIESPPRKTFTLDSSLIINISDNENDETELPVGRKGSKIDSQEVISKSKTLEKSSKISGLELSRVPVVVLPKESDINTSSKEQNQVNHKFSTNIQNEYDRDLEHSKEKPLEKELVVVIDTPKTSRREKKTSKAKPKCKKEKSKTHEDHLSPPGDQISAGKSKENTTEDLDIIERATKPTKIQGAIASIEFSGEGLKGHAHTTPVQDKKTSPKYVISKGTGERQPKRLSVIMEECSRLTAETKNSSVTPKTPNKISDTSPQKSTSIEEAVKLYPRQAKKPVILGSDSDGEKCAKKVKKGKTRKIRKANRSKENEETTSNKPLQKSVLNDEDYMDRCSPIQRIKTRKRYIIRDSSEDEEVVDGKQSRKLFRNEHVLAEIQVPIRRISEAANVYSKDNLSQEEAISELLNKQPIVEGIQIELPRLDLLESNRIEQRSNKELANADVLFDKLIEGSDVDKSTSKYKDGTSFRVISTSSSEESVRHQNAIQTDVKDSTTMKVGTKSSNVHEEIENFYYTPAIQETPELNAQSKTKRQKSSETNKIIKPASRKVNNKQKMDKYSKIDEDMKLLHNTQSHKTQDLNKSFNPKYRTPDILKILEETPDDVILTKSPVPRATSTPEKMFGTDEIMTVLDCGNKNKEIEGQADITEIKELDHNKTSFPRDKNDVLLRTVKKRRLFDPDDYSHLSDSIRDTTHMQPVKASTTKKNKRQSTRQSKVKKERKPKTNKERFSDSNFGFLQRNKNGQFDKLFDSLKNDVHQSKRKGLKQQNKGTKSRAQITEKLSQTFSSPSSFEPFFVKTDAHINTQSVNNPRTASKTRVELESVYKKGAVPSSSKVKVISNIVLTDPLHNPEEGQNESVTCQQCLDIVSKFYLDLTCHVSNSKSGTCIIDFAHICEMLKLKKTC